MKHTVRNRWLWAFLGISTVAALACESGAGPACTAEFRIFGVYVTDGAGTLLPGLDHSVTITNLGQQFQVDSLAAQAEGGFYPVLTDSEGSLLGPSGSLVRFTATDSIVTAQADFLFVAGTCHVEKVSGPDTVVAT